MAHAVQSALSLHPEWVVLELDVANAFNSFSRSAMFNALRDSPFSSLIPFFRLFYASPSSLHYRSGPLIETLQSSSGVRQGDPCGPFLFALTQHLAIRPIQRQSPALFISSYADDTYMVGPAHDVFPAYTALTARLNDLGLRVQPSKCSLWAPLDLPSDLTPPSDIIIAPNGLTTASRLLTLCISARPSFLLRTVAPFPEVEELYTDWDNTLLDHFVRLIGSDYWPPAFDHTATAHRQPFLPIRLGGFGLRSSAATASLSYLCSWAQTVSLLSSCFTIHGSPIFRPFIASDTMDRLDPCIPTAMSKLHPSIRQHFPTWPALHAGYPQKLYSYLSQHLEAVMLERVRSTRDLRGGSGEKPDALERISREAREYRVPVPDNVPVPLVRRIRSLELKQVCVEMKQPLRGGGGRMHCSLPSRLAFLPPILPSFCAPTRSPRTLFSRLCNAFVQFLCGVLAGGVVGACTGPLKNLQTRVIAQKGGRTAAEVASTAVHNRALRDSILSAGLKMPIIMTALNRGIQFYTFETVKAWLLRANQKHPKTFQLPESVPPSSVAGGAAGLAATLLLYPFSAVGDHMSLQSGITRPGKYPGLRQALLGVAQQHGASQLFRGVVPKLASMVPASAINFLVFESLKDEIKRRRNGKDPSAAHILVAGAIAGAASTIVTHPFELCRREINMSLLPKHATPTGGHLEYNSLRHAMRGILRKEGVRGLYRGVLPSLIELVPATAIGFMVYEMGKRVMVAEGQERRDEVKG
ncbi:unnamed protein product [Closterium sp. NIES-64]|nr:unnamed protein product [Closterium sp. NIES-64]